MSKGMGIHVSVCMASYNGANYIGKQIDSILCQLGRDDELIISDDGSKDNTINIINSFKDNRIKIVYNHYRKGPKGNFQNALEHANGIYIFLADQDDIWVDSKVDTVVKYLKEYDLVLTDCTVVNKKEDIIYSSFFKHRHSRSGFLYNVFRNSYMGCCMAFKRDILSYALPIPEEVHMHDWWIGLLVELKGKVYLCPESLMYYLRHGDNASPTGEGGYNLLQRLINRLVILWYLGKRVFFHK